MDAHNMQNPGINTQIPMIYDLSEVLCNFNPDESEAEVGLSTPRHDVEFLVTEISPQTPDITSLFSTPTYEWTEPNQIPFIKIESQLNHGTNIDSKLLHLDVKPMPVELNLGPVKDQLFSTLNPIYTIFDPFPNQNPNQTPTLPVHCIEPTGKQPTQIPIFTDPFSGQIYTTCDGYSTIDIETLEVKAIPTLDLVPTNLDLGQLMLGIPGLGAMENLQGSTDLTRQIPTLEVQPISITELDSRQLMLALPGIGVKHENTYSQDDVSEFEAPNLTPQAGEKNLPVTLSTKKKLDANRQAYLEFRKRNTQNTRNFRAKAKIKHMQLVEKLKELEKENCTLKSELEKEVAEYNELKAIFAKYKLPLPKF